MRQRMIGILCVLIMVLSACQDFDHPDMIVEIEVTRIVVWTPTPEPEISESPADTNTGPLPINSAVPVSQTPDAKTTAAPTLNVSETPSPTPTTGPTATPDVFPTPITGQILIAEQDFQNGKMFWLQPINQIWIATTNDDGERIWINTDDRYDEGQPESDPSLNPPAEGLIQPIRGFGLLWREDPDLQNLIGWATSEEFGYTTNYEYHWGGTVDDNGNYVTGPGYHLIETLNQNTYRFDEETRTWEIIGLD